MTIHTTEYIWGIQCEHLTHIYYSIAPCLNPQKFFVFSVVVIMLFFYCNATQLILFTPKPFGLINIPINFGSPVLIFQVKASKLEMNVGISMSRNISFRFYHNRETIFCHYLTRFEFRALKFTVSVLMSPFFLGSPSNAVRTFIVLRCWTRSNMQGLPGEWDIQWADQLWCFRDCPFK